MLAGCDGRATTLTETRVGHGTWTHHDQGLKKTLRPPGV